VRIHYYSVCHFRHSLPVTILHTYLYRNPHFHAFAAATIPRISRCWGVHRATLSNLHSVLNGPRCRCATRQLPFGNS
jgi:hypothetical protein